MFLAIRKRLDQREEGFTLIELLVVVIIIGILAAIAIPAFLNQRESARRAALQSDLRNAAIEFETYATNSATGTYTGATMATAAPNFRYSQGVQPFNVVVPAGGASFCLTGTHNAIVPAETWEYDSDDPGRQLNLQGAGETCNN